jgi:hypothetical protein
MRGLNNEERPRCKDAQKAHRCEAGALLVRKFAIELFDRGEGEAANWPLIAETQRPSRLSTGRRMTQAARRSCGGSTRGLMTVWRLILRASPAGVLRDLKRVRADGGFEALAESVVAVGAGRAGDRRGRKLAGLVIRHRVRADGVDIAGHGVRDGRAACCRQLVAAARVSVGRRAVGQTVRVGIEGDGPGVVAAAARTQAVEDLVVEGLVIGGRDRFVDGFDVVVGATCQPSGL